jgi:diguanylate cyclase (GGDEF)-like protein/PAS domain S-box-containing protein
MVACAIADVAVPLLTKQPPGRSCHHRLIEGLPNYVIGAAIAVAVAEIIDRGAWTIAPIAVVPMFFLYRAHSANVARVNDEQRRREVVESVEQGMVVVDRTGRITLWDEALDSILGCPRNHALGRLLLDVVPALAKSVVPRTMQDVVSSGNAKAVAPVVAGTRMLEVRILPVSGGVTLLCRDITQRVQAEQAARKSEARLALAAEGANDGLWEWDLRTQELFVSGRWKAMIGLPATAGTGPAEDWLSRVHPEDTAALKEALEAHIAGRSEHFQNEHRLRHEDGNYRRFLCRGIAVRNSGRRSGRIAGSLTDITERAIAQEQLRTAGVLDPLTGLSNRAEFVEELRRRLEHFKEHPSGNRFAALYLDLDRFKIVNDSLGHLVGDELLKAVSRRLESCLREGDALARLGGDEFAILLNGLVEEQQANAIAFRIQKSLGAPFSIGGREVFTSASIGIAFGRTQYNSPDEIMRDADRAMYHAKASGKARHELFDADMHARTLDRIGLESDLRHAVANDAFELHYQPIVLLGSGMCVGFESLIRWTRNGEPISPATFIPMAEELGLIEPVGTWCLQQACTNFADWKRRFPNGSLEYITVQRVEPSAGAAEFPRAGRAHRSGSRHEAVGAAPGNHRNRVDGQPDRCGRIAARTARIRREDLSRRLRHRLFITQPPAQAAG